MEESVPKAIEHSNTERDTKKDCLFDSNCLNLVNVFSEGSSIQAVSRISQANTNGCKTFWILLLILCICGCIFQVSSFLSTYFQYPVLIDLEVKHGKSLDFPAVTVCSLNRMKSQYEDCVKKDLAWFDCQFARMYPIKRLILSERKAHTSLSVQNSIKKINYKKKSLEFFNHYTNIDASSRKCYGYKLSEIIKKCSFNSVSCNIEDFTYFNSMQYGNCFTFNRRLSIEQDLLKVHKTGPNSGLELDIGFLEETYHDTTQATGSRVVIHNPDENPNPEDDGINISPGYEILVSMTKTSVTRLPPPYRDRCKEYKRFETNETITSGSQLDCFQLCMQQTMQQECGCVDPFHLVHRDMIRCNLKNETQVSCLDESLNRMVENGLPCDCPLPCVSTTYNLQLSSAISNFTSDSEDFGYILDPDCDFVLNKRSVDMSKITKHKRTVGVPSTQAKVKVFYGSLKHTIYTQKPMFTESELYGQLGGNLSLWLGLSIVAMFEYAEKLFSLIHYCYSKKKQRV
ncbi:hypothetical protein JTE90_019510 [Oedothorax gibbosus]|uniref:Uncharacterized protein n=1 Tax=Oedothorax gibbosus TaxID=931172 RepID=A0AAV6VIS5_9ARAC|nr:hypothetical protein JTE90_019510 [Oedothorax gibbosus]